MPTKTQQLRDVAESRKVAIVAALLMILVGCSASAGEENETLLGADHVLLAGSYDDKLDFLTGIADEEQVLIEQCMQLRGFEYSGEINSIPTVPDPIRGVVSYAPDEGDGYGVIVGYLRGLDNVAEVGRAPAPARSAPQGAEAEAYSRALTGLPASQGVEPQSEPLPGSCYVEAQTQLRSTYNDTLHQIEDAVGVVELRVEADSRMIELNREWARCMQRMGFAYSHPIDPVVQFHQLAHDASPVGFRFTPNPDTGESEPDASFWAYRDELDLVAIEERATADADRMCTEDQLASRSEIWLDYLEEAGQSTSLTRLILPAE